MRFRSDSSLLVAFVLMMSFVSPSFSKTAAIVSPEKLDRLISNGGLNPIEANSETIVYSGDDIIIEGPVHSINFVGDTPTITFETGRQFIYILIIFNKPELGVFNHTVGHEIKVRCKSFVDFRTLITGYECSRPQE